MMLELMVSAVEKNIFPTVTKQRSKHWTCQSSNHGSSTLNYDWLKKRPERYTDQSEKSSLC